MGGERVVWEDVVFWGVDQGVGVLLLVEWEGLSLCPGSPRGTYSGSKGSSLGIGRRRVIHIDVDFDGRRLLRYLTDDAEVETVLLRLLLVGRLVLEVLVLLGLETDEEEGSRVQLEIGRSWGRGWEV